ncbi:TPA: hypothetical protein N0F65_002222 [Lagenidium giganteum]|uniref:RING-type domain-containing protein n=1 Tax=Lagenidium giganteum TaxID=4803 RepID=A0AAV2YW17_9STRA|nr:TPA: hypothetical protein N0F65_002222 [Lagenidium giganteum]
MEITVRVEVQYVAPEQARIRDVLHMFRTPAWVSFMVRYISPHLKNAAPADKSVLENLVNWSPSTNDHNTNTSTTEHDDCSCVICMSELAADEHATDSRAVQLPCGHCFHHNCIQSWLKLRSTCPTCRFQFRKAFSGSYAVRTLNSALLLQPEQRQSSKEEILNTFVGKQTVRAVVNVTLGQIQQTTKKSQYPCVLNALLMHSNGESFTDREVVDKDSTASRRRSRDESEPVEEKMLVGSTDVATPRSKRLRSH